jgi:hypothetical protein
MAQPMERVHAVSRVPQGDSHHPLHDQRHRVAELSAPKRFSDPRVASRPTIRSLKILFLAIQRAQLTWKPNKSLWGRARAHFAIMFENRLPACEASYTENLTSPSRPRPPAIEDTTTRHRGQDHPPSRTRPPAIEDTTTRHRGHDHSPSRPQPLAIEDTTTRHRGHDRPPSRTRPPAIEASTARHRGLDRPPSRP